MEIKKKNQTDSVINQNENLVALTNKDDTKLPYQQIFEEHVKEKFDEIIKLTHETNIDDLIYYFKGDISKKKSYDFESGVKPFEEMQFGNIRLEQAKKLQNEFF